MLHPKSNDLLIANNIHTVPLIVTVGYDPSLEGLIANLAPNIPWGERKHAAETLGNLGNPDAVPALTEALPIDPFWMVRTAIIQAIEKIGDGKAIPTLMEVAETDQFQVVRAYAAKAVERLA